MSGVSSSPQVISQHLYWIKIWFLTGPSQKVDFLCLKSFYCRFTLIFRVIVFLDRIATVQNHCLDCGLIYIFEMTFRWKSFRWLCNPFQLYANQTFLILCLPNLFLQSSSSQKANSKVKTALTQMTNSNSSFGHWINDCNLVNLLIPLAEGFTHFFQSMLQQDCSFHSGPQSDPNPRRQ